LGQTRSTRGAYAESRTAERKVATKLAQNPYQESRLNPGVHPEARAWSAGPCLLCYNIGTAITRARAAVLRSTTSAFTRRGNVVADSGSGTVKSPEGQDEYVKEDLDQDMVTHQGEWRKPTGPLAQRGGRHLGALEDEMVPVIPPMSGPADLVGERDQNAQGNETGDTETGD